MVRTWERKPFQSLGDQIAKAQPPLNFNLDPRTSKRNCLVDQSALTGLWMLRRSWRHDGANPFKHLKKISNKIFKLILQWTGNRTEPETCVLDLYYLWKDELSRFGLFVLIARITFSRSFIIFRRKVKQSYQLYKWIPLQLSFQASGCSPGLEGDG